MCWESYYTEFTLHMDINANNAEEYLQNYNSIYVCVWYGTYGS